MDGKAAVLLAGLGPAESAILRKSLTDHGWNCQLAASFEDTCRMLVQREFDFVLCRYDLPDRTAFPLLDWLHGTRSTLMFSADSGGDSRWLPVVHRGERCLNRPLLRTVDLPEALADLFDTGPVAKLAGINA